MRPKKRETTGEGDLFRARLDQIARAGVGPQDRLGLDRSRCRAALQQNGRPGIESGFVIGLLLLKRSPLANHFILPASRKRNTANMTEGANGLYP